MYAAAPKKFVPIQNTVRPVVTRSTSKSSTTLGPVKVMVREKPVAGPPKVRAAWVPDLTVVFTIEPAAVQPFWPFALPRTYPGGSNPFELK